MKLRVDKFCALATSNRWQKWLLEFDKDLYSEFIEKLRHAKGCKGNQQIMKDMLPRIDQLGGTAQLTEFLQASYPQTVEETADPKSRNEWDKIFGSQVLSYPKRCILTGPLNRLPEIVKKFASDKINCRYYIAEDRAYVEYLDRGEEHLLEQIPAKNWQIAESEHD